MKTVLLLIQEYRRLRSMGCTRAQSWDLATFYVPLPWRAVVAAAAGIVIALVITFAAGRASAAEYRVSYSHPAIGARQVVQQTKDWMTCVKGAYATRARLVWARNLKVTCDGRAI